MTDSTNFAVKNDDENIYVVTTSADKTIFKLGKGHDTIYTLGKNVDIALKAGGDLFGRPVPVEEHFFHQREQFRIFK